jgi:hypothetical protein
MYKRWVSLFKKLSLSLFPSVVLLHYHLLPLRWVYFHTNIRWYTYIADKGKVPVVFLTEHHVMKAYWGSGGIAPCILDLVPTWMWVVSFTPRPLYRQGKSPCYKWDKSLDGPQSRSGRGDEEKNSQPPPGLELPIIQPVAQRYTTQLSRLLHQQCRTISSSVKRTYCSFFQMRLD